VIKETHMNGFEDDVATATPEAADAAEAPAANATAELVGASERLTRTVANGMAEMAGSIAGTVAATLAAPLTVAAAVAHIPASPTEPVASVGDGSDRAPQDEAAGEPAEGSEPRSEPSRDIPG
jgi:hypothetical protein